MVASERPSAVWSGMDGSLELTICPGYTSSLPDVIDVARLYWWADKGGIQRSELTRPLVDGIDVLRCAIGDVEAYSFQKIRDQK
jgi:hypothetical protein